MDISAAIESIRQMKRISKADMSKALDMDFSQYSRQEKKGAKLTVEQVEKIANALGVTMIELLTWGEERITSGNAESESQLNHLKNRVAELEDRIKDKISIAHVLHARVDTYELAVSELLLGIEYHLAEEFGMGSITYQTVEGKFLRVDRVKGLLGKLHDDDNVDMDSVSCVEIDKKYLVKKAFEDGSLRVVLVELFGRGVIFEPEWISAAKKYTNVFRYNKYTASSQMLEDSEYAQPTNAFVPDETVDL